MICGTTYLYLCCVSDFKNLVSGHNLPTKEMWNILLLELEIKYFPPIFLTQVDNNRHRICEKERKTNKVYCKDSSIASHYCSSQLLGYACAMVWNHFWSGDTYFHLYWYFDFGLIWKQFEALLMCSETKELKKDMCHISFLANLLL